MSAFWEPRSVAPSVTSTPDSLTSRYSEDENNERSSEADYASNTIAEALKGLSLQERDQVYLDQHGVTDIMEFDHKPELVMQKLAELERHLQVLTSRGGDHVHSYRMAEQQNPTFVRDTTFRLRFLYAELFDSLKAASRMIRYFNFKQSLFGADKLTKEIGLDDLDEDELVYMKEGYVQQLPARDTAGRPIIVVFPLQANSGGSDTFGRILFIVSSSVDRRIEKNGAVVIAYHLGTFTLETWDLGAAQIGARASSDLSVRVSAIHQCISDRGFRTKVNLFMRLSDKELRARHKVHFESYTECMYGLMTYGVPHDLVPVRENGTVKVKSHHEWLRRRELLENCRRTGVSGTAIELPTHNDVLVGKGRPIQEHRGNMSLQQLIDELLPHYNTLKDKAKKKFSLGIVQSVKAKNGFFLSQESGIWTEVSDDVAREKVSRLFRNRRTQAKNQVRKHVVSKKVDGDTPLAGAVLLGVGNTDTGMKRVRLG